MKLCCKRTDLFVFKLLKRLHPRSEIGIRWTVSQPTESKRPCTSKYVSKQSDPHTSVRGSINEQFKYAGLNGPTHDKTIHYVMWLTHGQTTQNGDGPTHDDTTQHVERIHTWSIRHVKEPIHKQTFQRKDVPTHKETHKQRLGQQLLIILGFLHYFQAKVTKQSQETTFFTILLNPE